MSMCDVSEKQPAPLARSSGGSTEAVCILVAGTEIVVDVETKLRLVACQFQHTPGVADLVGTWIESVPGRDIPLVGICARDLGAVPVQRDTARHVADIAGDVLLRAPASAAAGMCRRR
jgi:hypothetical protein